MSNEYPHMSNIGATKYQYRENSMNINTLKQQLKALLTKQYESAKPNQSSNNTESTKKQQCSMNIRSLFISLFSLNGIPCDYIHAHIL